MAKKFQKLQSTIQFIAKLASESGKKDGNNDFLLQKMFEKSSGMVGNDNEIIAKPSQNDGH